MAGDNFCRDKEVALITTYNSRAKNTKLGVVKLDMVPRHLDR